MSLAVSPVDDERIKAVLEQAKVLHASLDPLYTWDELCDLIGTWSVFFSLHSLFLPLTCSFPSLHSA